jgi:hypothetical protein
VAIEPGYCGALNALARFHAFRGEWFTARTASLRAVSTAGGARNYADPTVESLATTISNDILNCAMRSSARPSLFNLLLRRGEDWLRHERLPTLLANLKSEIARCEALNPYHIQHQDLIFNLRFQYAALDWLGDLEGRAGVAARDTLRTADDEPLLCDSWRLPGLAALQAQGGYPLALRNAEAVSIRLAQAIGQANGASSGIGGHPSYCYVESTSISPTGLRWVNGWAHDKSRPGQTAFGFNVQGSVISGGVTFVRRPEVAATLGDQTALVSGFSFPVPLHAPDEFGELQSGIMKSRKGLRLFRKR